MNTLHNFSGFEMIDESGAVLAKCESGSDLVKAHVSGYTRKDGTVVREHDDSRQASYGQTLTGDAARKGHTVEDQWKKFGGIITRKHMADDKRGVIESHEGTGIYSHHFTDDGGVTWKKRDAYYKKEKDAKFDKHVSELRSKK